MSIKQSTKGFKRLSAATALGAASLLAGQVNAAYIDPYKVAINAGGDDSSFSVFHATNHAFLTQGTSSPYALTTLDGASYDEQVLVFGLKGGAYDYNGGFTYMPHWEYPRLWFMVNGKPFDNPQGTVDISDNTVSTDNALVDNLAYSVEYKLYEDVDPAVNILDGRAIFRALYTVSNQDIISRNVDVLVGSLSMDPDNPNDLINIYNSSNGNKLLDNDDAWVYLSNETTLEADAATVVLPKLFSMYTRHGNNAPIKAENAAAFNFNDASKPRLLSRYSFSIPAGETRYVMAFHEILMGTAATPVFVTDYDSSITLRASTLVDDLSDDVLNDVVNYDFSSEPSGEEIDTPVLGSASLFSIFSVLTLFFVRRFRGISRSK